MRYRSITIAWLLVSFSSCDQVNYAAQTNPTLDSVTVQRLLIDSLREEIGEITDSYEKYRNQTEVADRVYIAEIKNSVYRTISSVQQFDTIQSYTTKKATYTASSRIQNIIPYRDTAYYKIDGNELIINNPDAFWRLYRFCVMVTYDVQDIQPFLFVGSDKKKK